MLCLAHREFPADLYKCVLVEFKKNWLTAFCVLMIGLVSFSRMYLGVHDIGDVFAGLLIGIIILAIWYLALIYKFNRRPIKVRMLAGTLIPELDASSITIDMMWEDFVEILRSLFQADIDQHESSIQA